jgi:hypothetical protein
MQARLSAARFSGPASSSVTVTVWVAVPSVAPGAAVSVSVNVSSGSSLESLISETAIVWVVPLAVPAANVGYTSDRLFR